MLRGCHGLLLLSHKCQHRLADEAIARYTSRLLRFFVDRLADVLSDHGISPYLLHCVGAILTSGPPNPGWRLGFHMLSTASELNYNPSTLSIAMLVFKINPAKVEGAMKQDAVRLAFSRFRGLVGQGRDPDALTLEGLMQARRGENDAAMRSFTRAIKASKMSNAVQTPTLVPSVDGDDMNRNSVVRPSRWTWEASCYIEMGKIFVKRGKRAEGEAAFRVAAEELDMAEAHYEFGQLQPRDSAERLRHLTSAAGSGHKDACRALAELELETAQRTGLTKEEADEHRRRASEWSAIGA